MSEEEQRARLAELVRTHFAGVWRFLRRLGVPDDSVDDAAQDVFLVASRRIEEIRFGSEQAFLFSTAFRIARTHHRTQTREVLEELDTEPDTAPTPEDSLDDKRSRELAYRLLDELDPEVRHVFVLYELEGMTMQQIGQLLEVPQGTVASRLRRAREDFQARLERHRKRLRGGR